MPKPNLDSHIAEILAPEVYRDVAGYEGRYIVSNLGNVQSLTRKTPSRWGKMKTSPGRVLKLDKGKFGYLRVHLHTAGSTRGKKLVHRLVAQAFIPNPDGLPCINHLDNDRGNNRVENLEWCTYKQNTAHAAMQNRLNPYRGERGNLAKLTNAEAVLISQLLDEGVPQYQLADFFDLTRPTVSSLANGKSWSIITGREQRKTLKERME